MRAHREQLPASPLSTEFPLNLAPRSTTADDIRATPAQRQAYLQYTQLGDPPADAVVEMFRRLPPGEGRHLFDTAIEYGIAAIDDPPTELEEFFTAVDPVPYWVDTAEIDLASRVIGRTGAVGDMALAMLALMGGYLASRVTKTLANTTQLDQMAPQRLAETMLWYSQVTAPGGLRRFAPGFKATLRVRLIHAMVRAGMARRPDWRFDEWDHPLNQSTLAGTNMLFALAYLAGTQTLGLHFNRRERDAIYHLWRYVGHLLGIDPHILPATESDYQRLLWLQTDYEFGHPDSDSVRLAQALIRAIGPLAVGNGNGLSQRIGRAAVTEFACAYARLTLGRANADFLQLPNRKPAQAMVIGVATTIKLLEYPRRLLPGATQWCERRGQHNRNASTRRITTMCRPKIADTTTGPPTDQILL